MTQCADVINNLVKAVDNVNTEILENMINSNVEYLDVCLRPNVSFDYYYTTLKGSWENTINTFVNRSDKCPGNFENLLFMYEVIGNLNKDNIQLDQLKNMSQPQLEHFVFDKILNRAINMISEQSGPGFVMDKNMIMCMKNLAKVMVINCQCQMIDIFSHIIKGYKSTYSKKLQGLDKDQIIKTIKNDYEYVKNFVNNYTKSGQVGGFSIENELNNLIPDELGKMKKFFVTVISTYFNSLHPIIWAQIFRSMVLNIFKDCPLTVEEWFSFGSKYLLLNSGPFILKILQMIRPVLTDEMAKKYNLTKLTYPLLEPNQIKIIQIKSMEEKNYQRSVFVANKSASVGHVSIGYIDSLNEPRDWFVIKFIKPLAIAQSCWEYDVLKNVFPQGSCEDSFIKNTLRANGAEMNVANEILNLERGHEMYTTDYQTEFGSINGMDIDAKLTTIENKPGIIKPGIWYALAMTLAPGVPIADLIENKLLENDTKLRANLHRCLDLLVVRFFYTLISKGFYHGDLHSGNVFYSYRQKQITMIDFGAMGDIDLFAGDDTTLKLLHLIIMSMFYNYDGMLDLLTDILNSKCSNDPDPSIINKKSKEYVDFKVSLMKHRIKNTLNYEKEAMKAKQYYDDITSQNRLNDEKPNNTVSEILQKNSDDEDERGSSIYDYFEKVIESKETIVEDKDILPIFTEVSDSSDSISFAGVMQLIIKFYATSNVNVAVKFSELNELQKAYALLLGVLAKVSYSSYRMTQAIKSAILTWQHIPKLFNVTTSYSLLSYYSSESTKFDELKNLLVSEKKKFNETKIKNTFQ